jgi:hypothetical protein
MDPKEPPPANEDRKTVDPNPPGVDPERRERRPDKPDDGPESEPAPDSPEAEFASHSE